MYISIHEVRLAPVHLLATFMLIGLTEQLSNKRCDKRDFGDGIVCACNATYCDTVEPNFRLSTSKYAVYSTTESGARLEKTIHYFRKNVSLSGGATFTVDRDVKFQKIIGFGGAFTDAAGINIASLSKDTANRLLESYFSPEGSEYTLARIPIASCDFSTHVYSYDDNEGDFELASFSLTQEDYKYKIPYIKAAKSLSKREIRLFASPWSAPGWLKASGKMVDGGPLLGKAGDKFHKVWAKYFVRFLEEYKKQNLSIWGITAQNEPLTGFIPHYEFQTMAFTAETQADFIAKDLGPALYDHGFQNVKLLIMDDQRPFLPRWPKKVMNNTEAAKYVSGIAVHWYFDFLYPAYSLLLTHQELPELFILYTEACEGYQKWVKAKPVILGSWQRFETYVQDIMDDLANWVSGWTDWNLALDMEGGPNWVKNFVDSPIIVNKDKDEFYKQPMYYALAHFSKFLPPDSYRISLKSSTTQLKLQSLAFSTPDGSTVIIVSNMGSTEQKYDILDPDRGTITGISPPRSLLTYVWW